MKNKSDLQRLSHNLQGVFGSKNWHALWQTYKLVESWQDLAGKKTASKSVPAYIKNRVLWIYVHDSLWMQHLHNQKTELLEKINAFDDKWGIEDIRWLLQPGGKAENEKTVDINRFRKISPEERRSFEQTATAVENKQCREALCRLWRKYHSDQDL